MLLDITTISFPGFGIGEFKVDGVAFRIFGRDVAWYGVIITLGIVLAFAYITFRVREFGLTFDHLFDVGFPTIILGVIGARTYYVLTTLREGGYNSFYDVIAIWNGGLGIYGGIIAGSLTVIVMTRMKRIPFMKFADAGSPAVILAQAIGRWGNFMNGEAFGSQTDIFCRMGVKNWNTGFQMLYVHPTFLYESLWNLLGFALANLFYRRRRYDGQIFHFVFAWYGFGRMFIELLRSDSLYISSHHAWYTKISVLVGFAAFVGFTSWMVTKLVRIRMGKEEGRIKA